jgi:hypothetical protein
MICQAGWLAPFRRPRDGVGFEAGFDELAGFEVGLGVVEGVEDHGLDLLVGEAVGRLDFDLGFLAAALLAGVTWRMPLASMRNLTSMRGRPAVMGGMPLRSKRASERQSAASSRSPCRTWMATLVWPSTPVVKCSVAEAGMVELRWMILATTPPRASMPSESGVTSSSSRSSVASSCRRECWPAPRRRERRLRRD